MSKIKGVEFRKTIEITVRYNVPDEISDIDFTRVENFDNFNFDKIVIIESVKELKVTTTTQVTEN
jgi:hypothetical protein